MSRVSGVSGAAAVSLTSADVDPHLPEDLYDLLAPDDARPVGVGRGPVYRWRRAGPRRVVPRLVLRRRRSYGPVEWNASDFSAVMAARDSCGRGRRGESLDRGRIALMVLTWTPLSGDRRRDMYPVRGRGPPCGTGQVGRHRDHCVRRGVQACRPCPTPHRPPVPGVTTDTAPVWACDAGTETAVMLDLGQGWEDAGYNAVVASSSAAGHIGTGHHAIAYASSWRAGVKRPRFCVVTDGDDDRGGAAPGPRHPGPAPLRGSGPVPGGGATGARRERPIAVTTLDGATGRIVTDLTIPLGQGTHAHQYPRRSRCARRNSATELMLLAQR